jgi:hypothetical protein
LKECTVTKLPGLSGFAGAVDHCAGSIHSDRVKIFVLPKDLQRQKADTRADIEDHSAFNTQRQRALDKIVFDPGWILESPGIDEGIDPFGCFQFR